MIQAKKSVRMMKPYNPPIEDRRNYVRLDFNENVVGASKKVVNVLKSIKKEELCTYPDYNEFKSRLAKYTGVKKEEVTITNASDEAIKRSEERRVGKECKSRWSPDH